VGLGEDDPQRNPLAAAALPVFETVTGGARPVLGSSEARTRGSVLRAIDATLGVPGRPQSGTGQTALLTGLNAARIMGRHFGPWVPTMLRERLAGESFLRRALESGRSVAFANSFPRGYLEPAGRGVRRPGAFPLAAHAAGLLTRDERSLRSGDALVSSITTDSWRRYVDPGAPLMEPEAAGRLLSTIASRHDLTVFAHFDTDYIGHRGDLQQGVEVIQRVDAFLGGVLGRLPPDTLLLVTSDHGNLEDVTVGHTSNPVPLLAVGPGNELAVDRVHGIEGVAALVLELLDAEGGTPGMPAGPAEVTGALT
jgi:2,3-bisphosphoglycerate-independent phosphoglycerate mutase